jgi:hypothetical protein
MEAEEQRIRLSSELASHGADCFLLDCANGRVGRIERSVKAFAVRARLVRVVEGELEALVVLPERGLRTLISVHGDDHIVLIAHEDLVLHRNCGKLELDRWLLRQCDCRQEAQSNERDKV